MVVQRMPACVYSPAISACLLLFYATFSRHIYIKFRIFDALHDEEQDCYVLT